MLKSIITLKLNPNFTFFFFSIIIVIVITASGVEIKNKNGNLTAPTPQNTPINPAPITSSYRPSIPAISEDMESITTQGMV